MAFGGELDRHFSGKLLEIAEEVLKKILRLEFIFLGLIEVSNVNTNIRRDYRQI